MQAGQEPFHHGLGDQLQISDARQHLGIDESVGICSSDHFKVPIAGGERLSVVGRRYPLA